MLAALLLAEDEDEEPQPEPEPEALDDGWTVAAVAFPSRGVVVSEITAAPAIDIEIEAVEVIEIDIKAEVIR